MMDSRKKAVYSSDDSLRNTSSQISQVISSSDEENKQTISTTSDEDALDYSQRQTKLVSKVDFNKTPRHTKTIISSSDEEDFNPKKQITLRHTKTIISSSDEDEDNFVPKIIVSPFTPRSDKVSITPNQVRKAVSPIYEDGENYSHASQSSFPIKDIEKCNSSKSNLLSSTRLDEADEDFIDATNDEDIIDASDEFPSAINSTIKVPKSEPKEESVVDFVTPRKVRPISISSSETSDQEPEQIVLSDEDDTSEQPENIPSSQTLFVKKIEDMKPDFVEVSQREYQQQQERIRKIQRDFQVSSDLLNKVNLNLLPDKGTSLRLRAQGLEKSYLDEVAKLSKMKITKPDNPQQSKILTENKMKITNPNNPQPNKILTWNEIEAGANNVLPKTFGRQAVATITTERKLTVDRLQQLHGSLQTCPKETDLAEPPRGLRVELMTHQKRALLWLMWREKQKPSGGILADDMGLGKTLTMISLMLKSNEIEKHKEDSSSDEEDEENRPALKSKYNGGTLVICPASLLNQWSGELECRTKRGLASCEIYHGPKRETKPKRLAQHDMVITTYSIVNNEVEKNGAVFRVKWRRIIIDEAHQIRNHKSQTSDAVCRLPAKSRWALSGTPVHNKELDMFALMKFLRCSPFDDLTVWKRWVGDKSTGGSARLHTVISSLMLRRTKAELIEKGSLNAMPERKWELMPINLAENEREVYSKILIFSRTLFAQFLHQRAEKDQDMRLRLDSDLNKPTNSGGVNVEYQRMRQKLLKFNKLKEIKQHEILVLLLRLRQICNHPSLITGMLQDVDNAEILGDDDEQLDKGAALDFLDQLNKLNLNDDDQANTSDNVAGAIDEPSTLQDAAKNVLNPSDPVFSKTLMSSKIKALLKMVKERVIEHDDKAIIVSQWPSFLKLIAYHLKEVGYKHDLLDGQVPVLNRMEMVDRLNNPKNSLKILLLSLTAGGVGLNLAGANHLFLLDLHWNPQLENQAQDRIYRLGQTKPVFIYKLMAADTIENRILDLQVKKLEIANNMLTGSSQTNRSKLSLQDLKMLFEM